MNINPSYERILPIKEGAAKNKLLEVLIPMILMLIWNTLKGLKGEIDLYSREKRYDRRLHCLG